MSRADKISSFQGQARQNCVSSPPIHFCDRHAATSIFECTYTTDTFKMEESANFIPLGWDRSAPEPHRGGTISNRPEKRIGATKGTILCHLELLATRVAIKGKTNLMSCRGKKTNCSRNQTCCQERKEEDQGRCEEAAQAKRYSAQASCKSLNILQFYK
jgi:hypothetical protein